MSDIPKVGIVSIIDHYTLENTEKYNAEAKARNPLRPSSAGKCARELAYELMEYRGLAKYEKEATPPDVSRLLSLGHDIESHLIRQLEWNLPKDKFSVPYKQHSLVLFELPNGESVEGNLDFCIISDKLKAIVDCKTKKEKYSSYYKTSWTDFDEALMKAGAIQFQLVLH